MDIRSDIGLDITLVIRSDTEPYVVSDIRLHLKLDIRPSSGLGQCFKLGRECVDKATLQSGRVTILQQQRCRDSLSGKTALTKTNTNTNTNTNTIAKWKSNDTAAVTMSRQPVWIPDSGKAALTRPLRQKPFAMTV